MPFRTGDVLQVAAPFVETVAASVDDREAVLRWPWRRVDPASKMVWAAPLCGFPFDELHKTLWRTEPPITQLNTGQRCRIGIPSALFHVVEIEVLEAPMDTGMRCRWSRFRRACAARSIVARAVARQPPWRTWCRLGPWRRGLPAPLREVRRPSRC